MNNRQFSFSFSVGVALAIFGAFIFSKAAVGLSLMALGAAISVLAVLTRNSSRKSAVSVSTAGSIAPAADY